MISLDRRVYSVLSLSTYIHHLSFGILPMMCGP